MNIKNKVIVMLAMIAIGSTINQTVQAKGEYTMKILSMTFVNNTSLPLEQAYGQCGGQNISPDLMWRDAPEGTKSYALIMHDPDAPMPGGFYHWLVIDIPVNQESIAKGQRFSEAKELKNDFQENGYGGPCPPSGEHRYNFTIYALDIDHLDVSSGDTPQEVEQKVKKHALAQATLTGLYRHK